MLSRRETCDSHVSGYVSLMRLSCNSGSISSLIMINPFSRRARSSLGNRRSSMTMCLSPQSLTCLMRARIQTSGSISFIFCPRTCRSFLSFCSIPKRSMASSLTLEATLNFVVASHPNMLSTMFAAVVLPLHILPEKAILIV